MTPLTLIFIILILCVAVWIARSVPVPFSYVVYALVVLATCVILLELLGLLGAGTLNHRL
jgi:hypothetical protein